MCHPVFQCFLSAHEFSMFSVNSGSGRKVILVLVDVLPPARLVVYRYFYLAEFLYSFQILRALEDIFFFHLLPCISFFSPYPIPVSTIFLHFLPCPLLCFWKIIPKLLFRKDDPHNRHHFGFFLVFVYLQKQVLFVPNVFNRGHSDVLHIFFPADFLQSEIRDSLNFFFLICSAYFPI